MIVCPWSWSWERALKELYHARAALCYCLGVRRRTLLPFFSPEGAIVNSQGLTPLVRRRCPGVSPEGAAVGVLSPLQGSFFSPEGAIVNSQGRQPLVRRRCPASQPRRGGSPSSVAPSGLLRGFVSSLQGLTPLAIDDRPFGAEERDDALPP